MAKKKGDRETPLTGEIVPRNESAPSVDSDAGPRPLMGRFFQRMGERAKQKVVEEQTRSAEIVAKHHHARSELARAKARAKGIKTEIDADAQDREARFEEAKNRAATARAKGSEVVAQHKQRKQDARAAAAEAKLRRKEAERKIRELEAQDKTTKPSQERINEIMQTIIALQEQIQERKDQAEDQSLLMDDSESGAAKKRAIKAELQMLEERRAKLKAELDRIDGLG